MRSHRIVLGVLGLMLAIGSVSEARTATRARRTTVPARVTAAWQRGSKAARASDLPIISEREADARARA